MAVNLSVKNVPDELAVRLRRRAAANRRSLQKELLGILEAAAGYGTSAAAGSGRPAAKTLTIEEVAEIAHTLFPGGTKSSVDYIRRMRDG